MIGKSHIWNLKLFARCLTALHFKTGQKELKKKLKIAHPSNSCKIEFFIYSL